MKRSLALVALATAVLLAGCGGAASVAPTAAGPSAPTGQPSSPAPTSRASDAPADGSAQFGGDICSALTKADIEGATYTQGHAVFDSTDTQKDPATGKAVVCQYLVTFNGSIAVGAATVTLLDDTEFATHADASVMAPEEAVSGIGTAAYLVAYAPGLYEVWVSTAKGHFKVSAQSKESATKFAIVAAGRD